MSASRTAPWVLGIDTATADATAALTRNGEPAGERRAGPGDGGRPRHSSALLGIVGELVDQAGGWPEVGVIAVGLGPGTFTGLRVGIATARALAQARALPLAGVSSLAALSLGIEAGPQSPRLAVIDARRSEVFAALHDPSGAVVWEPFVASPAELGRRVSALAVAPVAAGDGSLRFRDELESAGAKVLADEDPAHRMAARHVCELAARADRVASEQIRPIYLRRPDAEIWRHKQAQRSAG